ncbi:DUF2922 domain-containing protein [Metallumcola ferriviriculae]|uniref:DUF2922 domain-containing protein n=1 Tax=Metallumcola ferriviriculae TaxID=3039180 RepID=A0AAU0URD5_9FIRM|nr:DUF2922 domain-containing protein [Desulfitibacteraceae bacterium MK1]
MITKNLELIFQTSTGRRSTIRIPNPKDTLTAAEVQTAMNDIIGKNVFHVDGSSYTGILGARIVTRDVSELQVI